MLGRMDLKKYLNSLSTKGKEEFSARCGTSLAFVRNVAYGQRRAGESLCINIERESSGSVTCEELRPDVDWAYLRGTGITNRRNSDRRASVGLVSE